MRRPHWPERLVKLLSLSATGQKRQTDTLRDPNGRPVTPLPSSIDFDGYVDGVLPTGEVYGWVYDKADPARRLPVYLAIDGVLIGEAEAREYREDLHAAQKSDGHCAFMFTRALPEAVTLIRPRAHIRVFLDRGLQHELPHRECPLTDEMVAALHASTLDSSRQDLPLRGQELALTILLHSLPPDLSYFDLSYIYRNIMGFCHVLLQRGHCQWLRQRLPIALIQQLYDTNLPTFELALVRAIAAQTSGELDETDVSFMESCLRQESGREIDTLRKAIYPDPVYELIVSCFKDCHLAFLHRSAATDRPLERFLYVLAYAVANRYGDYHLAGNVMETLRRNADLTSRALWLEQSARYNRHLDKNFEAFQDLAAAIKAGSQSAWVFQEAASLLGSLCEGRVRSFRRHLSEILAFIHSSYRYHPQGGADLGCLADKVLRRYFQDCMEHTEGIARRGDINLALTQRREDIQATIAAIESTSILASHHCYEGITRPETATQHRFGRLLFIGSQNLRQCYFYRVEQKIEQAEEFGYRTVYRDIDTLDDERWKSDLLFSDAVYICRLPALFFLCKVIIYARNLHIPVIYDIDDYLFDERYFPSPLESYAGTIDQALHVHLTLDNPFFEYALKLADYISCSTPPLAEKITAAVGQAKPVIVHPNALDVKLYHTARQAVRHEKQSNTIEIFYGSATRAHKQVIYEVFGPALRNILARFANVKFTAFGYFKLPAELEPYIDRIEFREPTSNRDFYLRQLSFADINIAALEQDPFTDCKSEIKWLEAAAHGVPSIVSPTATYRAALTGGRDVLFAADSEEWLTQLTRLIESPDLRRYIGDNARQHAAKHFSPAVGASVLDRTLRATLRPLARNGKQPKPRLLYVNVWFAPQSVGGATRVFESHVRVLMEKYGDRYDLQVLTSQLHPESFAPYSVEQFYYGRVLVTRLNIPARDWSEVDDPEVYAFCLDFFLKQDFALIHFHALPVLTASPVAAARKLKIPYIITVHDAWWLSKHMFLLDEKGEPIDSRLAFAKPQDPARQEQLYAYLEDARAVLAVSEKFRDIYREAGISQSETNENGLQLFQVLPRTRSPRGKVRLTHVGGMSQHKGYHLFKLAVTQAELKQCEIHVIDHSLAPGEGYDGWWGNTRVFYRAKYQQCEINRMYADMDVLVAPSLWPEAFGLVTREAAYAGVWVIASDRGAVADAVDEGVNGRIVTVDAVSSLQQAVAEIDDHPEAFLEPCPRKTPRDVGEQVQECVSLYETILAELERHRAPLLLRTPD